MTGRLLIRRTLLGLAFLPAVLFMRQARTAHDPKGLDADASRQVTVFGIDATPGKATVDPSLREVAPQLRKLLPDYSFRLVDAENHRLSQGADLVCEAGEDRVLRVRLLDFLDEDGKIRLRVRLTSSDQGKTYFDRVVATPANQLVFLQKRTGKGRLLIGLGAR